MNQWEKTEQEKYNNAYKNGYTPCGAPKDFKSRVCDFIEKHTKHRVKVLDVGCGPAYGYEITKKYNIDYVGIDISSALVPYWKHLGVPAYVASAAHMPFDDCSFDFIVCWDVMEHFPEERVQEVFREIVRVGKGGSLVSFSIGLKEEVGGPKYGQLHLTVKSVDWWIQQLKEVKSFIFNENVIPNDGWYTDLNCLAQIAK
jgi:SAM-dependent methyltransferase